MFKVPAIIGDGIAFSPNGRSLVSPSQDKSVCVWNLRDGSSKVMPLTERTSIFLSTAFSPDGRYIAGGNFRELLWIWDSRRCTLVAKWLAHTDGVRRMEFSPDGKLLIGGSADGTVKCWDVTSLGTGSDLQSFPQIRAFSRQKVCFFVVFF